jgi:hypothetical protein
VELRGTLREIAHITCLVSDKYYKYTIKYLVINDLGSLRKTLAWTLQDVYWHGRAVVELASDSVQRI